MTLHQFAMIWNYNAHVEHQHIHMGCESVATQKSNHAKKEATNQTKPKTHPKPRETMTLKRKSCVLDGHLTLLFDKLTKEGWIEGYEAHFKALFSGQRDEDCQLVWKRKYGKGTLVELFKQLVKAGFVIVPKAFTLSEILESHFKDENGFWLTGLNKGNKANEQALPMIQECIRLLALDPRYSTGGGNHDEGDFHSEYDQYDHQDLKLHKHR